MSLKPSFVAELERIVGSEGLVRDPNELHVYESDGLARLRSTPAVAVLPDTADEVQQVVRLCHTRRVPFVARGHGTGLSGGALPVKDGVLIVLTRLNRVLDVDIPNQRITVEPGVINLEVTRRVAPYGYYYAPDPSSQLICSIGGNVAENSGGAHCLKYGFTVHHVLGLEAVLPSGDLIHVGGSALDPPGLDIVGVLVGSEGTLAIVTKVILKLLRKPETVQTLLAAFDSTEAAGNVVSDIIAAGIIPAAVEMMDRLTIQAAEAAVHPNFPAAEAVLIVELDGPRAEVSELFLLVEERCRARGAWSIEVAQTDDQRARIWKGTQGRICRDGARVTQLLRAGWCHPQNEASGSARAHTCPRGEVRAAHWQCLSRGRRKSSSTRVLRRERARSSRARRVGCVGNPHVLHRGRRFDYRGARSGRRQGRSNAENVHPRRSRHDAVASMRIRPGQSLQSRKGLSNTTPLR